MVKVQVEMKDLIMVLVDLEELMVLLIHLSLMAPKVDYMVVEQDV